jgi:hypothetical protein
VVTLIPEQPDLANDAEHEVWQRLREGLGEDDVLMASFRVTDEVKDHEADFVVLMPDVGIVVVEVKGGPVWHDDATFKMKRGGRDVRIDPEEQARLAKYALRDFVRRDPSWGSRPYVAWGHAIVVPHASFPADFATPRVPRWMLHDRDDQQDLVGRLRDNAKRSWQGKQPPTHEDVDLIVEILRGHSTTAADPVAAAVEREGAVRRLTDEQAGILKVARLLNRLEVRGGAGTGKTVLALRQARELARGDATHHRPAQRVALLCYSLGLAEHLRREVETWPRRQRPAYVGTWHGLGMEWGASDGDRTDSDFWENRLPAQMADLAAALDHGSKFDAVVVDEAQDFADSWWTPIIGALRDEEEGGLYVFSDENQRIFARFGRPPVTLVPLVLDHNLRNTRQIHDAFAPLAPSRMYAHGGDGLDVRFVPCQVDDAIEVADDCVDELLGDGWRPEDVCLLTTGHRHPVQRERTDFHDQDGYWKSFWDVDEVFYGHVLGCKGLERRAVVLCVNEKVRRDRSRERLYVGLSRATDQLVVVGDPAVIREIGGGDVAHRLGL